MLSKIARHGLAMVRHRRLAPARARELYLDLLNQQRDTYLAGEKFRLLGSGFWHIGQGGFSAVYSSPCRKFAIKVTEGHDRPYLAFLNDVVLKRQHNPYYPKIYGCIQRGNMAVVLMERLKPIPCSSLYEEGHGGKFAREIAAIKHMVCNVKEVPEGTCAHLHEVVDDIQTLLKEDGIIADMCDCNFMERRGTSGSQVVLTDPVTGTSWC